MNSTITWKDFLRQAKLLEEHKIDNESEQFIMYVHPDYLKYHPAVRYRMRYARRGQHMKRRLGGQKR